MRHKWKKTGEREHTCIYCHSKKISYRWQRAVLYMDVTGCRSIRAGECKRPSAFIQKVRSWCADELSC